MNRGFLEGMIERYRILIGNLTSEVNRSWEGRRDRERKVEEEGED